MRAIIALGYFLMMSSILPQLARADLSMSDRTTLNKVIEEFIRDNPKVVRDSLLSLATLEETERKQSGLVRVRDDRGDPVMGNPNGAITLYEFSDYNCGYCKRVFEPLQQMLRDNPDVRLVIKEFPILSQSSLFAAKAAIAAEMQGKFVDYHITMMTYRGQINEDVVKQAAQKVGLNYKQLQKDMKSSKTASIIKRTREAASALAINGTPGLVIGDTVVPGAIGLDELRELIANERAKKG
jgi:protein-disulfide isomerase